VFRKHWETGAVSVCFCSCFLFPDSNLEFNLSSLWTTCQSSPHTPHTSWHTWHIHLSNIWLPNLSNLQHFCVWKHFFWVDETLEIFIQNSSKHTLQCATTSQKKNAADAAKFQPPSSRADQKLKLFLFLLPVSQRTPLREQVVSCFCLRNPYGKTLRCSYLSKRQNE